MSIVLNIKDLSKSYGNIKALDNLSLTVEKGDILGLLGPNGSGKTTTLAIILSILKADKGKFEWFEGKYGKNPRKHIGAILETPNFYPYKTGIDNLKIIAAIKGINDFDYEGVLKLVNLEHRKNSKFRTYSLGMKQRLAIAATMIGNPEMVIFDEPTNGLDPKGIAEVRLILKRVAESGRTVLIASHILDEVEKICSHVAIIKKGKLLAKGLVGELLSNDYFLEINALETEKLIQLAKELNFIKSVKEENNFWLWRIDNSIPKNMISKILQDNNITLTHFLIRKQSLEEEFLEITKN
ncbi:MAG TPA: ATP-binding cassette domain-containing protein [Bacteroidetes bacterium]|nr:ATP-binding cassette domain-containing protein [Bacteroidota bacterium]